MSEKIPGINGLEITGVNIYRAKTDTGIFKGTALIVLNEVLHLNKIGIYSGANGLFVSFPAEHSEGGEGESQIFTPVKKELRDYIESEILKKYSQIIESKKPKKA